MRRTDIIIDGDNLREEYGVHLCKGSVANFISLPQFKDMDSDDWAEEDYLDVDTSWQVFARKEFDLTIAGGRSDVLHWSGADSYAYMSLGITNTPVALQKCVILGTTGYSSVNGLHIATVRFASDDDPYELLDEHSYAGFQPLSFDDGWSFERLGSLVNFGAIGVRVLRGTEDSYIRRPAAKPPLERDVSIVAGVIRDSRNETPSYQSSTLAINCLLSAGDSYSDFWDRYLHFLYMCTGSNVVIVHNGNRGRYLYSGMRVTEYLPSEPVPWLKFVINFTRIK